MISKTTIKTGEAERVDLLKRKRKEERKTGDGRPDVPPKGLDQSELC